MENQNTRSNKDKIINKIISSVIVREIGVCVLDTWRERRKKTTSYKLYRVLRQNYASIFEWDI